MKKILKKSERIELLGELRLERSRRYADRIRVILLLDDGETHKDIAKFLFLDQGTIRNYRKRYKEGGLEGLINDNYTGRKSFLSSKDESILTNDLQSRIFATTKAVIAHVKNKFKVTFSLGGMLNLLHRLGFHLKNQLQFQERRIRKSNRNSLTDIMA